MLAHQSKNSDTHRIYHYYQLMLFKDKHKWKHIKDHVLVKLPHFLIAQYSVLNIRIICKSRNIFLVSFQRHNNEPVLRGNLYRIVRCLPEKECKFLLPHTEFKTFSLLKISLTFYESELSWALHLNVCKWQLIAGNCWV